MRIWGKKDRFFLASIEKRGEDMKKDLIKILCCPTCKEDLELTIDKEEKGDIITGTFTCKKCKNIYPIEDGIPNLLPK